MVVPLGGSAPTQEEVYFEEDGQPEPAAAMGKPVSHGDGPTPENGAKSPVSDKDVDAANSDDDTHAAKHEKSKHKGK